MDGGIRRPEPSKPRGGVFWEWLSVGLVAWAAVFILAFSGFTLGGDNLIYDQLSRMHGREPSDRIVVVAFDDPSLAALGGWPWSRAVHARLLDRLTAAKVAGVAYDVLFVDPDPKGGDAIFAAALKRSGRTVLPVLTLAPGDNGRAVKIVKPVESLASTAARLGHVNLVVDNDGVARRISDVEAADGVCWPHLTLELMLTAGQDVGHAADCAPFADISSHVDALIASPAHLIPFAGPPGRFRTVSAVDVIRGEAPSELLKGRMVLVGATASGMGDRHMTTVSGRKGAMPGVEIQANILDAFLQRAHIAFFPTWAVALLSLIPVSAFMASLLAFHPSTNLFVGAGLLATTFLGSTGMLLCGIWIPPLAAIGGLVLAYPLWSWRRLAAASDYLQEEIARFDLPANIVAASLPTDTLSRQVTVLSRAADHLRDLKRFLEDALQSLPDAAVLIDHDGRVTLANSHAAQLAAQSGSGALVGSTLGEWLSLAIGGLQGETVLSALAEGQTSVEVTSVHGLDYEISKAELATSTGAGAGAILRLADITAIRSAMRQREEALQLLTHDIRAPLSSIVALVQSGRMRADGDPSDRIEAYAHRGLALAEGYVQFARAESYRFQPELFDLSQVVLDAADEIWPQAEKKSIRVDSEAIEYDVLINGDRSLVTRAIINILDNALKYSPSGTTVRLSLAASAGRVVCAIADEGPGMTPEAAAALFQPFNRGEAWRGSSTGAGLGLSVVHAVVKRHGGTVSCIGRLGYGARFELSFPLADPVDDPLAD